MAQESSGLYPKDPNFRMVLAIVYALRRDLPAANKELAIVGEQLGKEQTASLAVVLEVLSEVTNWEGMMDAGAGLKSRSGRFGSLAVRSAGIDSRLPQ